VKAHVIGSLLASLEDLKAIHMHATRVTALQRVYRAAAPKEVAGLSKVVDERSGTLVVAADSSAVAAKLRQLMPRIVAEIVKYEPEVTAIRVEVQVRNDVPSPRTVPRQLGPEAVQSFARLRDSLPESPLRQALSMLVERARRSDGQNDALQNEEREHDQR